MTVAVSRIRLPPKRSPSHPDAGMNRARLTRYATEMPSTAVGAAEKSRPMVGRATFTMVISRALMNTAAVKTTATVVFSLTRARTVLPSLPRNSMRIPIVRILIVYSGW